MLDIPPHIEQMIITRAEQRGLTVNELLLQTFSNDDEQTYYDWFYQNHFDIDRLDKAINSPIVTIPKGLAKNKEAFREWVKANAN